MNELIIQKENALEVFTSPKLDEYLQRISDEYLNFVGDIETVAGRKQIASKAYEVAKEKTRIDAIGKTLVEDWKKKSSLVDASRKKARDFLDELKDKVRKPVTDWEAEEEKRIQAERDLAELELAWEDAIKENEFFDKQKDIERRELAIKKAEEEKAEKERKELEEKIRLEREARIAKEAKEKAEREAIEQIEAAKRATIEAELKAKLDKERVEREAKELAEKNEREKLEAVERAKKEEIERQRKEQEEKDRKELAEKVAAELKAKNLQHQKKINREALEGFKVNGFEEKQAIEIITLIAKNKIPNISIKY